MTIKQKGVEEGQQRKKETVERHTSAAVRTPKHAGIQKLLSSQSAAATAAAAAAAAAIAATAPQNSDGAWKMVRAGQSS